MEPEVRYAKVGRSVTMIDPDTDELVTGKIVKQDTVSVWIQWNDIDSPCEHFSDEWPLIEVEKQ